MLRDDEINRIKELSIEETYNYFVLEITEDENKLYKAVRYGNQGIKFDLYDYFNNIIKIDHKKRIAIVKGKYVQLSDLYTEIEARNKVMKEYLMGKVDKSGQTNPRGFKKGIGET